MIDQRLRSVCDLECSPLRSEDVDRVVTDIRRVFFSEQDRLRPPSVTTVETRDISEDDPEDVRSYLLSLGIPADERVTAVWLSTRAGIALRFADLVRHYDDLWFPSRDDLWVTNQAMSWFVGIDHEELVTVLTPLQPWFPPNASDDDEPVGGEPPCMAHLLDEDGMMPDLPRPPRSPTSH